MALRGIKVIEMMGLAPGPMCGTILADFGANVTVVQRVESSPFDVMSHGKRLININLKSKEGIIVIKKMCATADVLLDTYRPGVMEKLGLGPEILMGENKGLIYARLTGYGQNGPLKDKAGHDINYTAMSGLLSLLKKPQEAPFPPINLLADFAGGSFTCALGILAALFERTISKKGQIIDASMTEGAAYLGTWIYKSRDLPIWSGEPGTNILDGGAPFYNTFQTKDDKYMAVGALEPQFYDQLLKGLNLSPEDNTQYTDPQILKSKFDTIFKSKTQEEWVKIFDNLDACVSPVLDLKSASEDAHAKHRNAFVVNEENLSSPAPAPKLSRTPATCTSVKKLPQPGENTVEILRELNYSATEIKELIKNGHVYSKQTANL